MMVSSQGASQQVEQQALVERARAGDRAAFAALTRRYQEMVLGYALSIVRDFHLAQDVAQESLFVAYRNLSMLENADRFPAWLRGIVRFQCGRLLRKRCLDLVPLEYAGGVAATMAGPEQQVEIAEEFHRVLAAIRALPEPQREAAMLFYIKDYSHREIAAFLGLPVTTINNRLHAARKMLKARLTMASKKSGRVVGVYGPVVDVQFAPEDTPVLFCALVVANEKTDVGETLQAVQRTETGFVRCLASRRDTRIATGAMVLATDGPCLTTVDAQTLTQAIPILSTAPRNGARVAASGDSAKLQMLETGIKVIDLLCPYTKGGSAGFFGPNGTGLMVVSAEVLRNTAHDARGVTIFTFLHGEATARLVYDETDDIPAPERSGRTICLPIDNPFDAASPAVLAASSLLDARTYLSFTLAKSGIWPAVDPLLSTSRIMDPAIIGQEHYDVASGVRDLLRRYRAIQESAPDGQSRQLSAEDLTLMARARKIQQFFTQPFFGAEPFTGRPGQIVPVAETIRACRALLAGVYDDVPEDAFMWRGGLDVLRPTAIHSRKRTMRAKGASSDGWHEAVGRAILADDEHQ